MTRQRTLAVAVCLGPARAEFVGLVGVRYCVTGSTVSATILHSRRAPDNHLWITTAAANVLVVKQAIFASGAECVDIASVASLPLSVIAKRDFPVAQQTTQTAMGGSSTYSYSVGLSGHGDASVNLLPTAVRPSGRLSAHGGDNHSSTSLELKESPLAANTQLVHRLTFEARRHHVNQPSDSEELSNSQDLDPQASQPIEEVNWYGAFENSATEAAFQDFAVEEIQRVANRALNFSGCFFFVLAIAIGVEQAIDPNLRARTATWRVASALSVLLVVGLGCFVVAALLHRNIVNLGAHRELFLVAILNLGAWLPLVLMPENICANRPHFIALVLAQANSAMLQRLPWIPAAFYFLVFGLSPIVVLSQIIAIQPIASFIASILIACCVAAWSARLHSLQARYRFADIVGMTNTSKRMKAFSSVLRGAIVSTFPRHCMRGALTALTDSSQLESERARNEDHWGSLVVAMVSFIDINDDSSRIARVIGDAIDSVPPEVAIAQTAGHEMTLACGFDNPERGCVPLLDFLNTLRSSAQAVGCPFIASLAVEEAQGALVGRRDSLRFHMIGTSTRIVRGLIRAYAPLARVQPQDSVIVATLNFMTWLDIARGSLRDPDSPSRNPLVLSACDPTVNSNVETFLATRNLRLSLIKLRDDVVGFTKIVLISAAVKGLNTSTSPLPAQHVS